jgi:hypothetical protein
MALNMTASHDCFQNVVPWNTTSQHPATFDFAPIAESTEYFHGGRLCFFDGRGFAEIFKESAIAATTGVPAIFITLLEAEERRISSTLKNCTGCSEFRTGPESGFAAKNRLCPLPAAPFGELPS